MNKIRTFDLIIGTILVTIILISLGFSLTITWLTYLFVGTGIAILLFGTFISIKIARLKESED